MHFLGHLLNTGSICVVGNGKFDDFNFQLAYHYEITEKSVENSYVSKIVSKKIARLHFRHVDKLCILGFRLSRILILMIGTKWSIVFLGCTSTFDEEKCHWRNIVFNSNVQTIQ